MRFVEIILHENGRYETYKQVTKPTAEKLYNEGTTIHLLPCDANPHSVWIHMCPISNTIAGYGETFTTVVNSYKYYNCNSEIGKNVCFFIKK